MDHESPMLFDDGLPATDVGYRGASAAAAAGISYRQLDYWARTELVEPSIQTATGSGSQRLSSFRDILVLKLVKRLLDAGRQPLLPTASPASLRKGQRFSTAQLKAETSLSDQAFKEGAELGLFGAQPHSSHEVEIAFALVALEQFGIQPRHLRGLKSAAEREVGIITGVTEPVVRKKAPDSAAKAGHIAREIAERFGAIRAHLIAEAVEEIEG